MDGRCDKDLVFACRQGDRSAYADLVRRHYNPAFLVCLGVLGNVHDAEDVAQDAMIKGFEQIGHLRQASQFGPWIVKIARNLSVNMVRRRKTMARALAERPTRPLSEGAGDERLQQAVAQLPWDLRLPLVMYYFDGQNVKSVARKLEISTSGVYQKLRTAITELQEVLTAQGDQS